MELTKASWTAGVEVRGFRRKQRRPAITAKSPGIFDLTNCPERQCFKCQGWGHEAYSCPSKVPAPKDDGDKKKKGESAVMAVNQVPDYEVTAETKIDENDVGARPVSLAMILRRMFPRLGNCRQKLQSRDGLQTVNARNL